MFTSSHQLNDNLTTQVNKTLVRVALTVPMFIFFSIFLGFTVVILKVFLTTPQVRETPHYVLFIHTLFNDVVYLLISFVLFLFAMYVVTVPLTLCYIIVSFNTCTFTITPYNLAVMSLERYVAICHPLRHAELWDAHRSNLAIANIWIAGMIPQLVNFVAYSLSVDKKVFHLNVICDWRSLVVNEFQVLLRILSNVLSLSLVAVIIAFTYIRVMQVARRMDANAVKAGRTVLLHAVQLMLSMLSFKSTFTENHFTSKFIYFPITNFFLFICLPRLVSPLIYGIRDEVFGKPMRRLCSPTRS